jgi:hypothetical protein
MKEFWIKLSMACLTDTVLVTHTHTQNFHLGNSDNMVSLKTNFIVTAWKIIRTDYACILFCNFPHHKHDTLAGITSQCQNTAAC